MPARLHHFHGAKRVPLLKPKIGRQIEELSAQAREAETGSTSSRGEV